MLKPRELRDWRAIEVECLDNGFRLSAGTYQSASNRTVNRFFPDLSSLLQGIADFIGPELRIGGPRPHNELIGYEIVTTRRTSVTCEVIEGDRAVEI